VRLHGQQLLIDGGLHFSVITLTRGTKINTIGAKLARFSVHSQKMRGQAERACACTLTQPAGVVIYFACVFLHAGSRFCSNWNPLSWSNPFSFQRINTFARWLFEVPGNLSHF